MRHSGRTNLSPAVAITLWLLLTVSAASGATAIPQMTGTLALESDPSGASVYIDSALAGTTPFISAAIPAGDHAVTLRRKGYEDYLMTISVPPGGTVKGVYTLVPVIDEKTVTIGKPDTGTLTIASTPAGASVYIDGALKGTTPYTSTTIAAGDHAILIRMDGYADFSGTASIMPGGVFSEHYTLACNVLSVSSIPSGASVYVDGEPQGKTPVSIRAIRAGQHTITLKIAGYEEYTTTENVPPGVEVDLVATLASTRSSAQPESTSITAPVTRPLTTATVTSSPATATVAPLLTTPPVTRRQECTRFFSGAADLNRDSDGSLNCTVIIDTEDHRATLSIPAGTRVTDAASQPVPEIRITPVNAAEITMVPGSGRWTGIGYHCLPDHAIFNQPVRVSFTISPEEWAAWGAENLTIRQTGAAGQGWEDLPTSADPNQRAIRATVSHFSIVGLFSTGPDTKVIGSGQGVTAILKTATGLRNAPLPLSPFIPDRVAPLAAAAAGIAVSMLGTFAGVQTVLSQLWDKIVQLLQEFLGDEITGLVNTSEIERRSIRPAENLSAVVLGLSLREILVLCVGALAFATAFIIQDRLEVDLVTIVIFVCAGGIATLLPDLVSKYFAYRCGCVTEYQYWGLGIVTMIATAYLFGNTFSKPSRALILGEKSPTISENSLIKLAGPLTSIVVALVSLCLIPLGGLFVIAGSAGFSINLLNAVFSLMPVRPNDGVEIFAWNRAAWAAVFLPITAFYLFVYLVL